MGVGTAILHTVLMCHCASLVLALLTQNRGPTLGWVGMGPEVPSLVWRGKQMCSLQGCLPGEPGVVVIWWTVGCACGRLRGEGGV